MASTTRMLRCFSTTAVTSGKLARAPLAVFGVEGRYASALYSAATKQKALDAVDKDLTNVQKSLKADKKFAEFLASPIIKKEVKRDAIMQALKKMNCNPLTSNFFATLADNGRLKRVDSVLGTFQKIMAAHKGEVIAEVTTAKPLEAAQMKELNAALQNFLQQGKKLNLETKIDPNLIGGMTVSIGDRYVDMSISTKVKKYEKILKDTIL